MASPFFPRDPFGPTGPTDLPFFLSPPPTGWSSRHAWEVALLLHQLPQAVSEGIRQVLPVLLLVAVPWRPARLEAGRWTRPEWEVVRRERLTARELAVSPAELGRRFSQELQHALRTRATPERVLGRGNRNRLLAAQSTRLSPLFEALAAVIGCRPALEAVLHALWERRR